MIDRETFESHISVKMKKRSLKFTEELVLLCSFYLSVTGIDAVIISLSHMHAFTGERERERAWHVSGCIERKPFFPCALHNRAMA